MNTKYLMNPFLKAQEKAIQTVYIPKNLRGIILRESQVAVKQVAVAKKVGAAKKAVAKKG